MASSRPSLLVVEDDPDVVGVLDILLTSEGYRVTSARNGAEALSLLRDGDHPSLILLDLMMPVMDGWQFRTIQRDEAPLAEIPVVIMTGAGEPLDADQLAADAFLKKPVDLTDLLTVIKRLTGA
ncbi:MAG TPA: response regulator [Kofleriaceae bacterium]|nr:response regulator [Kofleriaceae bacterium]